MKLLWIRIASCQRHLFHLQRFPTDVKVPIAILGAENDFLTPPALVKQFEEILASKPEVGSYVKIFPNVSHGWTTRYDINDPEAVKAAEEAHKEMLDWFVTCVQ
ncbi:hypothetical protein F2Q70_00036617 [Brassica cretica]|uniref:Dienelactone hydrolase domain-containing protein n=1 Tax=Brassica cretica TaxID=69181 RepID=A0A8S9JQJ1_BRACR|nr:hypothetical protein F2Q70_00036617 [Brassica cretica]